MQNLDKLRDKIKLDKRKAKHEKMHKGKPKGGTYHWDEKEKLDGHKSDNNS